MNPAEGLRAAATQVRKGWCQGAASYRGHVCALGAIVVSTIRAEAYVGASIALRNFLDTDCVAAWNDAPGQTAENVALTMERAADQWEQDHPDQVAPTVAWVHREVELVS